jgi:hypothetical protein
LIDVDFMAMSQMSLYRDSDALMQQRDAIKEHVFGSISTLKKPSH